MSFQSRSTVRIMAVGFAMLVAGKAWAQFPQGVKSGASPQASGALVSLAIPAVLGVNVAHNFVLDFNSGTKCWGTTGFGSYPQAPAGNTTYTFAVNSASIASSANVACPGAGAQPDVATVQVFSTFAANSRLQASIVDGGQGAQATTFTGLIADVFSANRLTLSIPGGDTCGGGTKVSPYNLQVAAGNEVTAIPRTGWSNCTQTLSLTLAAATPVTAGSATGTLTYTIVNP
ncbi:MAG: hypothetical protein ABI968_00165 [Acidobacteriota bacterium]